MHYFLGFDDQVRCFACDGGLKKWDPEDDPLTEHCRWFPECPFLLEKKGEDFVRLVQISTAKEIQVIYCFMLCIQLNVNLTVTMHLIKFSYKSMSYWELKKNLKL